MCVRGVNEAISLDGKEKSIMSFYDVGKLTFISALPNVKGNFEFHLTVFSRPSF